MKGSFGKLLMALGLLLILGAAALIGYNAQSDQAAGAKATLALAKIVAQLPQEPLFTAPEITATPVALVAEGSSYIGVLEIPALELKLPVMSSWSYENLKIAPCRYDGSAPDGSLIIAAHNYDSHFGLLKTLTAGDELVFTDVDGYHYNYEVSDTELLESTDVARMSAGGWDLTLFTCTIGGSQRVTVRCTKVYTYEP